MQPEQLKDLILATLEDNKGIDITDIDISELTDIANYFVICSATSTRHAKTLADKVVEASKNNQVRPFGIEGEEDCEWVLIDLSDVVVHIMLPKTREFYSLEKLWTVTEATRSKA